MNQRHVEVRPGIYRDSVALMQISTALSALPTVESALVAMATGLNLELLGQLGFAVPAGVGPTDLLVAVATTPQADASALAAVLDRLEVELSGPPTRSTLDGTGAAIAPRSTFTAVRALPASVVLVSTPGRYAFVEAMDALDAGASVMIFSDNVPVEQEIRLKQTAAERGLLVLGPDCGTAVIGGVGLGFANVVRPGPVGLVAASGTGAQQVMCLLAAAGVGISHCLGVGGRDMSAAVGGRSARTALQALDADPGTELIVMLGKPPAPEVATLLREHAAGLATPVLFAPLGPNRPDLTAVTEAVLSRLGVCVPAWPAWPALVPRSPGAAPRVRAASSGAPTASSGAPTAAVRGLFSGGTLCVEAMVIASATLGRIWSNVPVRPEWTLPGPMPAGEHAMVDLGSDEYTVGRPHPMIDFGPRLGLLAAAAGDPSCRVVLLDVVLGHGAHPDPAAELAPAIRSALGRGEPLDVVASLIGTADDPQDLSRQAEALRTAGATMFLSNAAAVRHAVELAGAP